MNYVICICIYLGYTDTCSQHLLSAQFWV